MHPDSFGGRDDGSLLFVPPLREDASPAHIVTDAYVVTTAIHADRMVMSGHATLI